MAFSVRRFIFELVAFVLVTVYEFVKFYWHQGHRDGRKKLSPPSKPFLSLSAMKLAEMIRNRELTSEELVKATIERIRQTDKLLCALVDERFNDALEEARNADKEIADSQDTLDVLATEKPFLGVPFTTKDAIGVRGLLADNGNIALKGLRAEEGADCVRKMKEAGGIALAVTNVPEMCMWIESANKLHGRCTNPYDIHRTPGGSTGGEGCLIAACATVLGIGSDIGGSIRTPSAWCGIFGHKTTPGFVSRKGLLPVSKYSELKARIGVVGPMARTMEDVRAMLRVIVDNPAALRLDEEVDVKKLRFYFSRNEGAHYISSVDSEISAQVDRTVDFIRRDLQCQVEPLPRVEEIVKGISFWTSWVDTVGIPNLKMGYDKPEKPWEPVPEFFKCLTGQSDRNTYSVFSCFMDDYHRRDRNQVEKMFKEFEEYKTFIETLLADDGLLILPGSLTPAPFHHGTLLHPGYFGLAGLINVLRLPSTAVPMGLSSKGLPLGVQIVGNHANDRVCLAFAQEMEKKFGGYIPPF